MTRVTNVIEIVVRNVGRPDITFAVDGVIHQEPIATYQASE